MSPNRARIEPNRAGDALRRLVDLVSHRSGAVFALMSDASVTLPQILLMSRVEKSGSTSLSDLAEGSTASAAAVSQMIERLVRLGLLDRAEDPVDRRRKAIRITARARALLRRLEAARSADYELGLDLLGEALRTRLAAMLELAVAEIENACAGDRRDAPAGEEISR